ncbi:hypothetical protein U1Q18_006923 [Sarracenia purpurea var. burkii]
MVKTSTDHAMLQRGETGSENTQRSIPESIPAKTVGEQIQEQSTICRMELDDDVGYGAEITGMKKSAKSQPHQFTGVTREIPNQGWQGEHGNLGTINAIEEEERICNRGKDSGEDDRGSPLLATPETDMATETNSNKQQDLAKQMWPPQSTNAVVGEEPREIRERLPGVKPTQTHLKTNPKISLSNPATRGADPIRKGNDEEDVLRVQTQTDFERREANPIPLLTEDDSPTFGNMPRLEEIPQISPSSPSTKSSESNKDPRSSWKPLKHKASNGKDGKNEEDVNKIQPRENFERGEGNLALPLNDGESPNFSNHASLGNLLSFQNPEHRGETFRKPFYDGSEITPHPPSFPSSCSMQIEEFIPQPPPHLLSPTDNLNLSLRKRKKWARKSYPTSLSSKKKLSPPNRKRKDVDSAAQLANPKKPKSHDDVTTQNESPLLPFTAAAATQPCRPL